MSLDRDPVAFRAFRRKLGITQTEVAKAIGCSAPCISKFEVHYCLGIGRAQAKRAAAWLAERARAA